MSAFVNIDPQSRTPAADVPVARRRADRAKLAYLTNIYLFFVSFPHWHSCGLVARALQKMTHRNRVHDRPRDESQKFDHGSILKELKQDLENATTGLRLTV